MRSGPLSRVMHRKKGEKKGVVGCETPLGNGSSGGHTSGRGAPLLPTRPAGQVRFGKRPHEAETPGHAPRLRPLADGEGRRNPRASGRPFASHPPGRHVAMDASVRTRADRRGRPFPSGPVVETLHASRHSRFSADRGVLWTGVEPVTPRLKTWCSTSELPRPGPAPVPNPCTEHAVPTVRRWGKTRRGPDEASRLRGPWYRAHTKKRRQARPARSRGTRLSGR